MLLSILCPPQHQLCVRIISYPQCLHWHTTHIYNYLGKLYSIKPHLTCNNILFDPNNNKNLLKPKGVPKKSKRRECTLYTVYNSRTYRYS